MSRNCHIIFYLCVCVCVCVCKTVFRLKEETWIANILEQLNLIPSLMFKYIYITLPKEPNLFT